jgi:hypothetical protein
MHSEAKNCIWYPDEDVCPLRGVPNWVKKQRKIQKMGATFENGYFTVETLNRIKRISRSIRGLDPDKN